MIKIINCNSNNYKKKLITLLEKRRIGKENVSKIVSKILKDIKKNGNKALLKYERKFSKNSNVISTKNEINKAIKILNNLKQYNFSQGVVVRNQKVVAIEGKGGTKKMLEKCRSKKIRNQGVLVKFPKKKQDLRIDLPTVGLNTFKQCKITGLKGIVLKKKQNIFLEKKACIDFVNKNKMFILVK